MKTAPTSNQQFYDAVGNPLNYMGHNLSWTMDRQLASFDDISYTYDENGIRTSKTSNGVTTKYYLKGSNIIYQTDGTDALYFFYDSKDNIVGFNYADNDYFYVKNKQGDITDITDSNGEVVASYTYDPWGKVVSVVGDETIGNLNPFRYRSYYYDSDIQMYYLQSRYYDPSVCRFINCDNVNYIGTKDTVISYNSFAYCENDPVNDSDPNGALSINSIKNLLIKFANTIKYGLTRALQIVAEKAKSFFVLVKYDYIGLHIRRSVIASLLDSIINTYSRSAGMTVKSLSIGLKVISRKFGSTVKNFFKRQVIPVIGYGGVANILNKFRKAFWFVASRITNYGIKFADACISSWVYALCSITNVMSMISIISSAGNFIAAFLDATDGDFNTWITFRKR